MNVLPDEKRLRVFAALVDSNSTRAIERMTDVHQRTIRRFGLTLGEGANIPTTRECATSEHR